MFSAYNNTSSKSHCMRKYYSLKKTKQINKERKTLNKLHLNWKPFALRALVDTMSKGTKH